MRFHPVSCGVLALAIGASAAQAQTVFTGPVVGQPVGTVVAAPSAVVSPGPLVCPVEGLAVLVLRFGISFSLQGKFGLG